MQCNNANAEYTITPGVVRTSLMARCTRYNIMIKFVSDMRQVGGFLRVLQFHPPITLNDTI